jgi:hypothetical protein
MTHQFGLSKTKITAFEQCPRKLWLSFHRPEVAVVDPTAPMRFAAGHEAGAVACALHSAGVMIEAEPDLAAAIAQTFKLVEQGHTAAIFEATFAHDGVLVRIDIMEPDGHGGWHVAEVKSSTAVKGYHIGDLATQLWVMAQCGIIVSSAAIRHIDNRFVLARPGDYAGLFTDVGILTETAPIVANRADVVASARQTLAGTEPDIAMGSHCSNPFNCEFSKHCGSTEPMLPDWPIALLPNTGKSVARQWAEEGIYDLRDIPEGALGSPVHNRIHRATMTGEPFHDLAGALAATAGWTFPRAYLDFETIAFAVPRWVGTKPYQQVTFQFSCHIERFDGTLEHHEFLSIDGSDPRRACAEALVRCVSLNADGCVIAYNASFERRCILDLADACPDLGPALRDIASRLVDLLPVTRANYYHRDQRGSWSIKAVLPTVAVDLDYGALDVKDGGGAQMAFLEAVQLPASAPRRLAIETALLAYCKRDTEAMIILLKRLCQPVAAPAGAQVTGSSDWL